MKLQHPRSTYRILVPRLSQPAAVALVSSHQRHVASPQRRCKTSIGPLKSSIFRCALPNGILSSVKGLVASAKASDETGRQEDMGDSGSALPNSSRGSGKKDVETSKGLSQISTDVTGIMPGDACVGERGMQRTADRDEYLQPAGTQAAKSVAASSSTQEYTEKEQEKGARAMQHQPHSMNRGVMKLVGSIGAVVVSGVANRLLYKMAITPLSNYVFFMAQLQTFGYCAVYFTILFSRYRSGVVDEDMLKVPQKRAGLFTRIGMVEALSSLLGFVGAARLPGVVLPLLSQTSLFWQVLLARVLLGKRLSGMQVVGVLTVVTGVVMAAWPAKGAGSVLANVQPLYAWLFVLSMLFPALDTIFKESLFRSVREERGRDLDLFVVNSFGSLSQAAFVFMLLPLMTMARGMSLGDLPAYMANGFMCLRGLTPACGSDCSGAPLLPLAYVATNLVFNIAALSLIRTAGNVVMSLVMSAMVPLTIWAFTLDLPYLPPAPQVGPTFLAGAALLVAGLGAYNAPLWMPALRKKLTAWLDSSGSAGGGGASGVVTG